MHLIIPRKEEEGDCLNDDTRKLTVKVLIGISVTSWCILLFAFFGGIEEYQESVIQVSCCMPFVLLFLAQLIWESTEEQKKIFLERRRKRNKAAGYRPEFWDMSPEEITVAANIAYEKKREEELRSLREIALERDPIIRKMTDEIFSDLRKYDISVYTNSLEIRAATGGSQISRNFIYRNIYHRNLEDIREQMESDLISPRPTASRRYSRYHGGANDVGDSGSGLGDTMADDDG
jgi:hypothetical protein